MKTVIKAWVVTAAALWLVGCSATRPLTAEQQQALETAIEDRDFQIEVSRAYPTSGRSINLTTPYSLTVKGDSVNSYLPYFGRAYSVPYGGGSGLNFEGMLMDYKTQKGRRDLTTVTFTVKSPDDLIRYQVDIWPGGNASIQVTPQNRQSINFDGTLVEKRD